MTKHILLTLLALPFISFGQMTVTNSMTVEQYIQNVLAGSGVTITNIQYNGGVANVPKEQVGSFVDGNSDIGLADGLLLGSGDVTMAMLLNTGSGLNQGGTGLMGTDTDLASITPNQIYDECVVEFDFVPLGDTIKFNYVFASEEYEEYVCASVNDAFGFFLTGANPNGGNYTATNIALVPDPNNPSLFTTTPVSINTINPGVIGSNGTTSNCSDIDANWASYNVFYTPNTSSNYEYDGSTVVLQAKAAVICNQTYHIKLAIGDAGDGLFDSGVFLEGGSFSSDAVEVDISALSAVNSIVGDTAVLEGCIDAVFTFIRPDTIGDLTLDIDVLGSAINGTDYTTIADSVFFASGQDSAQITITTFADGLTEGVEDITLIVYTITPCGDTIETTGTLYIIEDYNVNITTTNDTIFACPQDSVLLTAVANSGVSPYSYSWSTGQTNDSIYVYPVQDTFYTVIANDFCNTTSIRDTINISFTPYTPLQALTSDTMFCDTSDFIINPNISGGAAPLNYAWSNGTSTEMNQVNLNETTTFYINITDNCNITLLDSVEVIVNHTPYVTIHVADTLTREGCIDGIFTLVRTDTVGDFNLDITISGGASNGNDYTSIADSVIFLNGQDSAYINIEPLLDAQTEPSEQVIISYFIVNQCNDTIRSSNYLTIVDEYTYNVIAENDTTFNCPQDNVMLTVSPISGIAGYNYTWNTGQTGDTIFVNPTSTTSYTVVATDTCSTVSFPDTVNIVFNLSPFISSTVEDTEICLNSTTTLTPTIIGGVAPLSYQWNTGSNNTSISVSPNNTTSYTITTTDACNTTISATAEVTVLVSNLNVSLDFENPQCDGVDLFLSPVISNGIPPYNYTWSGFGILQTNPQTGELIASNPQTGNYSIIVTDACGLTEMASTPVEVIECDISIPNIITPNGDDENDFFIIDNLDHHPNTKIVIYNRWGRVVFKSDNYKNNWNGVNMSGNKVSEGTYYYALELVDTTQCENGIPCNGFITVMH